MNKPAEPSPEVKQEETVCLEILEQFSRFESKRHPWPYVRKLARELIWRRATPRPSPEVAPMQETVREKLPNLGQRERDVYTHCATDPSGYFYDNSILMQKLEMLEEANAVYRESRIAKLGNVPAVAPPEATEINGLDESVAGGSGKPMFDRVEFAKAVAPRETQMEPKIPDDLLVDWKTLNEPYVHPMTLEWAIQRDRNMQDFASKLILRIARLENGGR